MKKLPISIQSFRELRHQNCIYVDKTELIHQIISGGKAYFLSRPRRFGKSMTLSTIKEIFLGNKALFEGLWIEDKWDWTKTNPVIHIPFASYNYRDSGIDKALQDIVLDNAEEHNIKIERGEPAEMFRLLIKKLCALKGRVVILIDEYDKPIIDFLEKIDHPIAKANRAKLRNFYSCIKDSDDKIEFFFMTGVSRFSQTGVFSNLNHLNDITSNKKYVTLCGYTPEELEYYFKDRIDSTWESSFEAISREEFLGQIRKWYNGYSWDGKRTVYNPFSILNFFEQEKFRNYWFQSGSPKFLIDLIREQEVFNFNQLKVPQGIMDSYEIEHLEIRTLLFQTGYLTIKHYDEFDNIYTLDYPNREVEESMHGHLIGVILQKDAITTTAPVLSIKESFLSNDIEKVIKTIKSLLKDVPSLLLDRKDEHFYHALVHLHFKYLGLMIDSEVHTSDGRMDAVVKTATHIYILEFKINQDAAAAMQQIKAKNYGEKYFSEQKEIIGIGINFDTELKALNDWAMEKI
jgi:Predicted AAA-ATPase/PD-(D/E)XK nuclease superfamily